MVKNYKKIIQILMLMSINRMLKPQNAHLWRKNCGDNRASLHFTVSVCKHGFHTESSRGVLPAIYLAVTQFLLVCFEYSNGRRGFF